MQQKQLPKIDSKWKKDTIVLVFFLGSLFFLLLGIRPLFVPDEGRYAEIAREMTVTGNYITPYLNFVKYFEKPPLFYWLGAIMIKLFGTNLWGLRSINAVFSIAGCLITYLTARQLYNREVGFYAALILGTSTLFFAMGHIVNLDMPVTFFMTATFYSFLLAITSSSDKNRKRLIWLAAICAGLSVLTKGLIGLVLPGFVIFTWFLFTNEWRLLKKLHLLSAIVIFFAIVAPWHFLVGLKNPEFFYFYFIEQHFLRYTTMDVGHYQPIWYFIPCLLIGFFPWIVFLPQTIINSLQKENYDRTKLFLLLWAALIFIFFSFSKSKLMSYILPVLPPLAILTAYYLQSSRKIFYKPDLLSFIGLLLFSSFIAIVFWHFSGSSHLPQPHRARLFLSFAAGFLVVGNTLALLFLFRNKKFSVFCVMFSSWLFLLFGLAALPSIDTRTILPFAKKIKTVLKPEDEIVTYGDYYQDLPFYLKRRITVVGWLNELGFGTHHQDASSWMIDSTTFWGRWNSDKRLYVLMSNRSYNEVHKMYWNIPFFILGQDRSNILVTNHPLNYPT